MAKLTALLLKNFRREGQPLTEFNEEIKELTPADKEWYKDAFRAAGETVEV